MGTRRHFCLALSAASLAACKEPAAPPEPTPEASFASHPASGEIRARIVPRGEAPATLRSGPKVPVSLPRGFTLYPGGKVISNTVVERNGRRRILLVFVTPDRLEEIVLFYRAEAQAAGVPLDLDLAGETRASIGGSLPGGGTVAIAAQRDGPVTRVNFSAD